MDEFFGSYIISYVIFDDSCFGCRISHQDFKIFEPKGVGRIVFLPYSYLITFVFSFEQYKTKLMIL